MAPVAPVVILALLVAGPLAQPAAPAQSLPRFLAALQQAAARDDRRAVAALARYPLEVTAGTLKIPVADADAFVALYDTILTPAVKATIAAARIPAAGQRQNPAQATSDGGLILGQAVTIRPVGDGFRVVAVNVRLGAPQAVSPGEPVARLLSFRVGAPTQVSGTLTPGGVDRYEFHAERGIFVDARLSGFPGRAALLRLVNSQTGEPVDARAGAGTRVWTGRVGASARYRIEVARQPDSGQEPLIYTLSVTLK